MLALRELERKDIPTINRWRRNEGLISCLGAPYRFVGREIDEAWFDSYLASRSDTIRCVIVDHETPEEIFGLVTLASINWVHRSCVLHIMIGDEVNCGRGFGTFAVDAILKHAFLDLNLHRVELQVLTDNVRAIGLYEKLGFKREGIRRQAAYKSGEYADMALMSILQNEWKHTRIMSDGMAPVPSR